MPHVDQIILIHGAVWLAAAILSGIITAIVANSRNQSALNWFFIGAIAPFVSFIALFKTKEIPPGEKFYISESGYRVMRRWYAALIALIAMIVYAETAQPTVPFWDCGEFIACSYSLSVPHPPGAPLFLLIGRLVSMLPLDFIAPLWGLEELTVAHKLNLMSGLFNALAIGVLFLIVTKAAEKFFYRLNKASDYGITLVSGFVGALLAAFAYTYWNNAVEAEVYGPAMLITNAVIYIAMMWYERREKPDSDRYLVFIPYILYLGIAIHLTVMIILPAVFLFVIFSSPEKRKDPFFWLTWIVLFSVATTFSIFLWCMALGLSFSLIGTIIAHLSAPAKKRSRASRWVARSLGLSFITLLLAALAFGICTYTLIRSAQDPLIDENDPETIESFADYMDRKQYGQESMWELMFKRKGQWKNQLGVHPRMGFWGFFMRQWSSPLVSLRGLIPFAVALFGIFMFVGKHKQFWLLLFLCLLVATLGLVIYINFSDGTQGIKLEVRDRDYFFTPGYMLFSGWIGVGIAAILALFNKLRRQARLPGVITLVLVFIMTLLPVVPLKANWFTHDRSRNYIPHDYAYNILNSCDKNSVLFTNGDNDTFPLWFLQVVKNIRSDVCIANLSLLNTNWYIKQLKTRTYYKYTGKTSTGRIVEGKLEAEDEFDLGRKLNARGIELVSFEVSEKVNQFGHDFVPIAFTDDQIDLLRPYRTRDNQIVRVQDIMVRHLIDHTKTTAKIEQYPEPDSTGRSADTTYVFDPPIYFAVTVSPENKLNYASYLRMEGLAYRLTGKKGERQVEPDIMKNYLFNVYKFRGLNDSTIDKDDNSLKLLQNYTTAFMTLALELHTRGRESESREVMERALEILPYDWRVAMFSADIYAGQGKWEELDSLYEVVLKQDPHNIRLIRVFADVCYQKGNPDRALGIIKKGRKLNPDDENLFTAMLGYYYASNKTEEMNIEIEKWLEKHPENEQLRRYMNQIKQQPQMQVIPKGEETAPLSHEDIGGGQALPTGRQIETGPVADEPVVPE